jgi:NADPH2:quinone reductase
MVAPADRLVKLPDAIDSRTAAALMVQGLTGHVFTSETYPVQPGDWVLVHAGAGGTGRMLVQAAKMRGATVVATVSSAAKAAVAAEAGADHVIRYDQADFADACRELAGFAGFVVTYDSVGGEAILDNLPLLRRRGMLVSMGKSAGPLPPLELDELNRLGSLYVTRPNMGHYIIDRADLERHAAAVFAAAQQGRMKVLISKTFPLAQAAEAQDLLASRGTVGKLLLLP